MEDLLKTMKGLHEQLNNSSISKDQEVALSRSLLCRINEYFFQTDNTLGVTDFDGEEMQFFSAFHKYWSQNYEKILNAHIDTSQTKIVANCLNKAIKKYGSKILGVTHDTHGLDSSAIAQVRFFTANQDFRKPPEDPFGRYLKDSTQFDANRITTDPDGFLKYLGATGLSQNDKRTDFARNGAKFLVGKGITAADIAKYYDNDATKIREALVSAENMGYGSKKANMFIRDMFELGVWPSLKNFDQIDVASDINTMKLALRTGILKTDIPLISSFLDIFCYQYSYIDKMSSDAWRVVWQDWTKLEETFAPSSPSQMDFLLYRIGREYCDDKVVKFKCERGHELFAFGARKKTCDQCQFVDPPSKLVVQERYLPCQLNVSQLPHKYGKIDLKDENLLKTFEGICIFEDACLPKRNDFHPLDPPKSISIKGQTGWTESYAFKGRGGGGMMG